MGMLCPECLGELASADGQTARCTIHGGEYQILFTRTPPASPEPAAPLEPSPLAPGTVCRQHPNQTAVAVCAECGAPVCPTCAFPVGDGRQRCPDCAAQPPAPTPHSARRAGVGVAHCVQHPHLVATRQCQACGAYLCTTCAFQLPGGICLCPSCAVSPKAGLSPRRKKMVVGAYLLAAWATLALVVLLGAGASGALDSPDSQKAADALFGFLLFIPSLVGTGLAFASRDRRLRNPPSLWGAIIWNSVILGCVLLLILIGLFSGA